VNIPFDFTFAGADSAEFFKNDTLANNGNASLKAITDAGYTLAECQIVLPVASDLAPFVWITALNLEVSAACVVDIGFLNAGDTFVPLDTHVCTTVAAGGISRNYGTGIAVPLRIGSGVCRPALRASAAARVTGQLDLLWNR
jgi:hypothetical protein